MDFDRDSQSADEYFVTALQIFDCCGSGSAGTLRVDALMEKFAPFIKTNKAEYSYLKSLLDPEQSNPEINVTKLAKALHKYSDSQKAKVDLDESFNIKNEQLMPQDSDSGISADGFQELQCELREKAHLAHKLRSQLDFTDRHHEEVLATITAERDSLRAHLNILREENLQLTHFRRDYEEACERLCASERALDDAKREVDACRRRVRGLREEVTELETEKLTLQEQLTKSKDECHRINEMYASRQADLLGENEALKAEQAFLNARLQDQVEYMQQMIKDKTMLELELKDMLNKSNPPQLLMDRSIDVSYTDDQMLTALDTINADSRFSPENQLLSEESFLSALKEDQGRFTNVSLYDELRLSISRHNIQVINDTDKSIDNSDNSTISIGTQTDEGFNDSGPLNNNDAQNCTDCIKDSQIINEICDISYMSTTTQTDIVKDTSTSTIGTQTITIENIIKIAKYKAEKCKECENLKKHTIKLESELKYSHSTMKDMQHELDKYEANLSLLQKLNEEGNERNNLVQSIVQGLRSKIGILEASCAKQNDRINELTCDVRVDCADCQTNCDVTSVATQAEEPCVECKKRHSVAQPRRLRKYLWEPIKCLFQIFAVVCFVTAVTVLYGVTRRWHACDRDAAVVPWRWLDAQEFMDLLLRIEYVADVPM